MPDMPKFKVYPRSFSVLLSALLAMVSFILLVCVNWPTFHGYAVGTGEAKPIAVVFYSILVGSLLVFGLCTLLVAKKTLIPSLLFSFPVVLFFLLDISGLRATILDFSLHDTLWHYLENSEYYKSSWWMILLLGIVILVSFYCFARFSFGRARYHAPGALITGLCAALWTGFSVYRVIVFDFAAYTAGKIDGLALAFTALTYVASSSFFFSQFLLVMSLKRVAPAVAQAPLPVPMTVIDPFVPLAGYSPAAPSFPSDKLVPAPDIPQPVAAPPVIIEDQPQPALPVGSPVPEPIVEPETETTPPPETDSEGTAPFDAALISDAPVEQQAPLESENESEIQLPAEPAAQPAPTETAPDAEKATTPVKKPRGRKKKKDDSATESEPMPVG